MTPPLPKPAELFDRNAEWADLATFATNDRPGATLAVVYGRRRQGKTLLLELLAERTGGFMAVGLEQSSAQNLDAVSRAYGAFADIDVPVTFRSWEDVIDALFALGEGRGPTTVVLDELPYLQKTAPEIPSLIQRALSPRGSARQRSRTRLILCGSAFSVMAGLLTGTAPLRGRATREVVVNPFDFRDAAAFWGVLDQPDLAIRVHALVGGTPAYRDFCDGDLPDRPDVLDPWVARHLLNPSSAFFREGRSLLAEEPELNDLGLYSSVLGAIAAGRTRRSQIADAVGRKETALAHPLSVLLEARVVDRQADAVRANRPTFHICEPMLRLHQLVVAPNEARLTRRQGTHVWAELADTVQARIYGPHFEELARQWTAHYASATTVGGHAGLVGTTVVSRPDHHGQHEVDVVAVERAPGQPSRVLLLGEAKWRHGAVGIAELDRLHHLRQLVPGADQSTRLAVFSRSGFTPALVRRAASATDVELVDLDRLYRGD